MHKVRILFLICLVLPLWQCKVSPSMNQFTFLSQIPAYSKTLSFDWSTLPVDQKADFYKWSEPYIDKVLSLRVMTEKECMTASRIVTRGEFIEWVTKIKNIPYAKSDFVFTDTPPSHPHYKAILAALEAKIIEREDTFRPDDPLLRQEASVWLVKAKGDAAFNQANSFTEPIIAAQDGFYEIPKEYCGPLSVCFYPEHQLLQYRCTTDDDFRYVKPDSPMMVAEAAYSLIMLAFPPKAGGTITIGMSQEPKSLFSGVDQTSALSHVASLLYNDTIGGRDENWRIFPMLIKRIPTRENGLWKVMDDGRMEVTFELRKGAKWADGVEITAKDAVFNFLLYNHPSFPTIHSETDFWVDNVIAKDDYTVTVYWNRIYAYANISLGLMPAHYFEKTLQYTLKPYNLLDKKYYDPSKDNPATEEKDESYKSAQFLADEAYILKATQGEYNKAPMHAGPYKVKKWELGQSLILEPNENYLFGKPLLDGFTFRTIENTDTLLAAVLAGNVDMTLTGITVDQAIEIKKRENCEHLAYFTPSGIWDHIDLNTDHPMLSDVKVRQALLYSMDRQGISDKLYFGMNQIANTWIPPKHPAYNDENMIKYTYDKKKAEQLLEEAGWKVNPASNKREKDGKVLTITFMTTAQNKLREQMQAVISTNWKDIGIEVIVKNEQASTLFGNTLRERRFPGASAIMYAWTSGPIYDFYSSINSKQIPTQGNGWNGQNYAAYKNEVTDKLTIENLTLLDKLKINKNLMEIDKILNVDLPVLPLFFRIDVTSAHKALRGYNPNGIGANATWNGAFWSWDK